MSDETYVPRISVNVTPEILDQWETLVPWGLRSKTLRVLVEQIIKMVKAEGAIVIAMIIAKKLTAKDILDMAPSEEEKDGHI